MAADVILGYGTRFYYSLDGASYVELTDMEMIGPPDEGQADVVEVTPMNPTARRKEYKAALIESGKHKFSQKFKNTRMTLINGWYVNQTLIYFRVVVPDHATVTLASKVEWSGTLTKCGFNEFKRQEQILINVEVQVSGTVTYTPMA